MKNYIIDILCCFAACVPAAVLCVGVVHNIATAQSKDPIQRAVIKYEREMKRKALAVIDVDGNISRHATPQFAQWLEAKSGLRAVRRRVLIETARPLPVEVRFETVDDTDLRRLCEGVK